MIQQLESASISEKGLLHDTNTLLSRVGISAKKILSIEELRRVSSSMFVAIYEALMRSRVGGIRRKPKTAKDYILNLQVVIDSLSNQLHMDLRHITGDSIFHGDVLSLSNLVYILLKVSSIQRGVHHENVMMDFGGHGFHRVIDDTETISTHDSAFPAHEEKKPAEFEAYTQRNGDEGFQLNAEGKKSRSEESPLHEQYHIRANTAHLRSRTGLGSKDLSRLEGPEKSHSPSVLPRSSAMPHSSLGSRDDMHLLRLRSTLKAIEQESRVEAARRRRSMHTTMRVHNAMSRNHSNLLKSCEALQRLWKEDSERELMSQTLRRSHEDDLLMRNVHRAILKEMGDIHRHPSQEASKIVEMIRQDTKKYFETLHGIFEERLNMIREGRVERGSERDENLKAYIEMMADMKRSYKGSQIKKMQANRDILLQRELRKDSLRNKVQKQILASLSSVDWKDSLRDISI